MLLETATEAAKGPVELLQVAAAFVCLLVFGVGPIVLLIYFLLTIDKRSRQRIATYLEERGGRLASCHRTRTALDFLVRRQRRYAIRYFDALGNEHQSLAKSSLWDGVFLSDEEITYHVVPPPLEPERVAWPATMSNEQRIENLEAEVRRLREELRVTRGA